MSRPLAADLARMWFESGVPMYALLDGASIPDLPDYLRRSGLAHVCLYRGALAPDLARAAPYLVRFAAHEVLARDYAVRGWGEHWGVFFSATASLRELRRHCRRFLMILGPQGKPMYFRYYDPRVLPVFLATCDTMQLRKFFGPIRVFYAEQALAGELYALTLDDGSLQQQVFRFGLTPSPSAGNFVAPGVHRV